MEDTYSVPGESAGLNGCGNARVLAKISKMIQKAHTLDLSPDKVMSLGGAGFAYLSTTKVRNIVSALLAECGVVYIPAITAIEVKPPVGSMANHVHIHGHVTLFDTESGESVTTQWCAESADSGDKATNKALAYFFKSFWCNILSIGDGTDPEGDTRGEFGQATVSKAAGASIIPKRETPAAKPVAPAPVKLATPVAKPQTPVTSTPVEPAPVEAPATAPAPTTDGATATQRETIKGIVAKHPELRDLAREAVKSQSSASAFISEHY